MKIIVIYRSGRSMNTQKIAAAMAEVLGADLAKVEDVKPEMLSVYDLIGLGSGIYASKIHRRMFKFIKRMPLRDKNVFIFCTSGSGEFKNQALVEAKLAAKGSNVIGEFHCPGEFSPLGFNLDKKGHPDELDVEKARLFAAAIFDKIV
ncbi:flavodoxin domain-containing protein [Paenibacillus sp. FSL H3-0333]|uniref:flavodoxin domain-containing protein n=1 Tax=Paenibacillus sp. FSL H3-0333 TaxID=2921373 RepID=UPI0030FA3034